MHIQWANEFVPSIIQVKGRHHAVVLRHHNTCTGILILQTSYTYFHIISQIRSNMHFIEKKSIILRKSRFCIWKPWILQMIICMFMIFSFITTVELICNTKFKDCQRIRIFSAFFKEILLRHVASAAAVRRYPPSEVSYFVKYFSHPDFLSKHFAKNCFVW